MSKIFKKLLPFRYREYRNLLKMCIKDETSFHIVKEFMKFKRIAQSLMYDEAKTENEIEIKNWIDICNVPFPSNYKYD